MKRDSSLIPLSHQHQHGLALTVVIDRRLGQPGGETAASLRRKTMDLWQGEVTGHFAAEEEILFPAVRDRIASAGLVEELIGQHRRLQSAYERVRDSPEADWSAALRSFAEQLRTHIRLEERRLFEEAQAALSADELTELGRRLEEALTRYCPLNAKPG